MEEELVETFKESALTWISRPSRAKASADKPPELMLAGQRKDLPDYLELEPLPYCLDPCGNDLEYYHVESKHVSDHDWQVWHKNLRAIGGSSIAELLGHGYSGPNTTLDYYLGRKERPEPNNFSRQAMAHGQHYEPYALDICFMMMPGFFGTEPEAFKPQKTKVFVVTSKRVKGALLLGSTPDYVSNAKRRLIEIKCPYYGSQDAESAVAFRDSWLAKNPNGKTAYFLQAAYYAWLNKKLISTFYVAVLFVKNNEEAVLRLWTYQWTIDIGEFFSKWTRKLMSTKAGKLRVTDMQRKEATTLMCACYMGYKDSDVYSITFDGILQKQCEDETWDDSDCVPRQ